jgi:hypothetical protein
VSDIFAGLNAGIKVGWRVEERGEIASQRYFTFGKAQDQPCPPTEAGGCSFGSLGYGSPVNRDEWLGLSMLIRAFT